MELKLVRAKAGCSGCYYENEVVCPADQVEAIKADFSVCSEDDQAMIFVPVEPDNKG